MKDVPARLPRFFVGWWRDDAPRSAGHGMVAPRLASGDRIPISIRVPAGYPGIYARTWRIFHDPFRGRLYKTIHSPQGKTLGLLFHSPHKAGRYSFRDGRNRVQYDVKQIRICLSGCRYQQTTAIIHNHIAPKAKANQVKCDIPRHWHTYPTDDEVCNMRAIRRCAQGY